VAILAERACRHDPSAVVRLVADGTVLAAFVATPFDCLGMRAARLTVPAEHVDVVVEAVGLAARARTAGERHEIVLPPSVPPLRWTTGLPPRTGWQPAASLRLGDVIDLVAAGTEEFRSRAQALPAGQTPSAALDALANDIWGRPMAADHPVRLAHAASYLGFLDSPGSGEDAEVALLTAGSWRRLDAPGGSTLMRVLEPLGLFVG
jgi:hypothetical protein